MGKAVLSAQEPYGLNNATGAQEPYGLNVNKYNGFKEAGASDQPNYYGGPEDAMNPVNFATGNLAARHGETNSNFSGTKSAASKSASYIEKETVKAYKKIKSAAVKADTTPEQIALNFLLRNLDRLERYIRSKGETPSTNDNGIIVQAVLLRMQDVNIISSAGNLSEDEAMKEIQEAESEAILNSTADKDLVLDPDTQAALNCLIVLLLTKMDAATGAGDIRSALNLISVNSITPLNNFNDALGDPGSGLDLPALTPVDLTLTPATTTDTSGGSSASFFDILNKIAATAQTVAGAIKTTSGAVSGSVLQVSNAVQTAGANTGASAISLYMQRNGLTILIIGLLAIVLLIILVRVTK